MSKKSWPILYSMELYRIGEDFLDFLNAETSPVPEWPEVLIQPILFIDKYLLYVQEVLYNILLYKICQDFLDIQ